jgi:N-formylglutamate amidohydrolase
VQGEPFVLTSPTGPETPVVVEVPHAGLDVPPGCLAQLTAPARALVRDADLHVDRLYADAPAEGASLLVARASRYVIDLNRAESDVDEGVVEAGGREKGGHRARFAHGLIWRVTSDGEAALARPLTRAELEARLRDVYRPYHAVLAAELARKRARFGVAVLLAAHSMPSQSRGKDERVRADVVPGSRGRTSADARFIEAVESHARAEGFSVVHDDPYAGGFSTQHYGRPKAGIHAVQVELARRLYLDEGTCELDVEAYGRLRAWCRSLVKLLARLSLGA